MDELCRRKRCAGDREPAKGFENAKVELIDEFYGGKIALIRDRQGAGFTIYDGGQLKTRKQKPRYPAWNELHVSNASLVIPFYENLFGWTIHRDNGTGRHKVFDSNKEHISDILVIPNPLKGKYEYWVCTFAVNDLAESKQRILEAGGDIVFDEGERVMMHDDSGEAFFYIRCFD